MVFFSVGAAAFTSAYFGQGTGSIWIDDAQCTGSENRLIDCTHDTSTVDCGHGEDAGVRCSTTCKSHLLITAVIHILPQLETETMLILLYVCMWLQVMWLKHSVTPVQFI